MRSELGESSLKREKDVSEKGEEGEIKERVEVEGLIGQDYRSRKEESRT